MKPCLVIGSGFHSWVLGKNSTPLSNWDELIDQVAENLLVSIPSHTLSPVLRWEKLLELASDNGYRKPSTAPVWIPAKSHNASQIEPDAKLAVRGILESLSNNYPHLSSRAKFPLNEVFAAVISLNFDNSWLGNTNYLYGLDASLQKSSQLSQKEFERLHCFIKSNQYPKTKIWYPNGSIQNPETIRMGLYDFGSQPHALKHAFNHIKSYENDSHQKLASDDWVQYEAILERELENHSTPDQPTDTRINNWVTDFLYRPIYFAGVGLSKSEIGLWWLLAQRARNLAKIPPRERPATTILVNAKINQKDFWDNKPCGVEALYCDNWDSGWEMIMDRVNPKPISGGRF